MELRLERVQLDPEVTIGHLTVDGSWECWTCEDEVRDGPKVPGKTAIPYGNYNVKITWSPHFNRQLPLLQNVPGFDGVRIHPGNTAADTEGCILVGMVRAEAGVGRSRAAFDALFGMMQAATDRGEAIDLVIV